ncbi:MAG TPA: tyrosine-type recombinase/integrase [Terriglobales bacterium]|nr:tyrosine-type recombinase/integrase [Terriglobales bacterium]
MNRRTAQWNPSKQRRLCVELKGFWSEDVWDMRCCPVEGLSPNSNQRHLRFECKSPTINGELKYVFRKKFVERQWTSTQELSKIHLLMKWLNSLKHLPVSLMERDLEWWRRSYTAYLKRCGMYRMGTTSRMDGDQQPRITPRDSAYISTLRQAVVLLGDAYDERSEQEKDIWDLRRLSMLHNPTLSPGPLNFLLIKQPWLRAAAKSFLAYCLPIYAEGTCRTRLQALVCFSEFLAIEKPRATARSITRPLLLRYLSYLPNRVCTGTRKNHIINLRTFLEMAHRERWLPVGPERLIHDEEVPQPAKPQPRYIPSTVLDQLNQHLHELRPAWMRMVLILQECGMRINELLQLPLDCLSQDARGVFYLRYLQGKVRRENAIPVSQEITRVVQEQQEAVRERGKPSALLFPSERGRPIRQASFTQAINHLAYTHQIKDAMGKLFRFQSHQFRHTVGTRMINLGVPHHIIQRYLGHKGPEMTSRYAHIHDSTMREKLSEYLAGTLVDVSGKKVVEDTANDTAELQWFTRNVLAQALTNGYCAIPTVAGPCPHPNACLNCAHFRTDITFLDVHRSELRETERVIAKADANGWVRQSEMNQRKRTNLVNIIASLEAVHA